MAYTPQQWHDDTTDSPYGPISGDRLNYIEAGIQAAAAAADAAGTAGGGGSVTLGTAAPIIDGVAAAGSSGSASHEDHVHPTDTSRAALASPTFSGAPSLPTGAVGVTQSAADSSTKLATTAFVTTADNLKANLAGPTFTGTVTVPNVAGPTVFTGTATIPNIAGPTTLTGTVTLPSTTIATTQTAADNSTKLSTTAYADAAAAARAPASGIAESAVTNLVSDLAAKAPLASPTFTGTATIPNIAGPTTLAGTVTLPSTTIAVTPSASDNSTKPATTAYVDTADALKANLASPTFTGTVTVPSVVAGSPTFSGTVTIGAMAGTPTLPSATIASTQTIGDSSTKVATTAFVASDINVGLGQAIGPNTYANMNPFGLYVNCTVATLNDSRFVRVTMAKTGVLHDVSFIVGIQSGSYKIGVYDTGNANGTHTTSTQLAASGSVAVPAPNAWMTYDPALSVTAGDTLNFHLSFDNTTAAAAGIATSGAAYGQLPNSSFYPPSGAGTMTPKIYGLTSSFWTTPPSTITDANHTTAGKAFYCVWRIT